MPSSSPADHWNVTGCPALGCPGSAVKLAMTGALGPLVVAGGAGCAAGCAGRAGCPGWEAPAGEPAAGPVVVAGPAADGGEAGRAFPSERPAGAGAGWRGADDGAPGGADDPTTEAAAAPAEAEARASAGGGAAATWATAGTATTWGAWRLTSRPRTVTGAASGDEPSAIVPRRACFTTVTVTSRAKHITTAASALRPRRASACASGWVSGATEAVVIPTPWCTDVVRRGRTHLLPSSRECPDEASHVRRNLPFVPASYRSRSRLWHPRGGGATHAPAVG